MMMKFRVFGPGLLILLVTCLYSISVQAQADHPAVITPQNISDLSEVRRIGGTLPGKLAWSPDGKKLAVGTSAGAVIYTTVNLDQPPGMLDAGMDVKFSNDDMLISDGKIWNLAKNSHYSLPPEQTSAIPPSPSGRYEVRSATKDQMLSFYVKDNTRPFDAELKLDIGLNTNYAGIAFSRDEHLLALAVSPSPTLNQQETSEVQIWNVTTGRRLTRLPHEEWYPFEFMRFSDDNRQIVVFTGEHHYEGHTGRGELEALTLWNVNTGKRIKRWAGSWDAHVISSDKRWIAYNSNEGLLVWNGQTLLETGVSVKDLMNTPGMAFSQNNRVLISVGTVTTRLDLNPVLGTVYGHPLMEIGQNFQSMYVNVDGSMMLAGTQPSNGDELSILWRTDDYSFEHIVTLGEGHIDDAGFSPDGKYVFLHDFTSPDVTVWSTDSGELAYTFPSDVKLSPDWKYAAYWKEGIVQLIDLATGQAIPLKVIDDYRGKVLTLNVDVNMAVLASENVDFYSLSGEYPEQEPAFTVPITGKPGEIVFSANGIRVAVADEPLYYTFRYGTNTRQSILIWDLDIHPELVSKITNLPSPISYAFELSPDGEYLVTFENFLHAGSIPDNTIIHITTGEIVVNWAFEGYGLYSQKFTPDGLTLFGADRDHKLFGWQIVEMSQQASGEKFKRTEEIIKFYDPDFRGVPSKLALSPMGNYLVALCEHETVCVYDIRDLPTTGALLSDSFNTPRDNFWVSYATSILFNPTETLLLIKDAYKDTFYLRKVEPENDRTIIKYPEFPGTGIAAFSPDGQLLAAENADNIALYSVYNLIAGNTTPLRILEKPRLPLREVIFSKDGRSLYVRDDSGVSIWGISR